MMRGRLFFWYAAHLMPPNLLEKGISKRSKPAKQALHASLPSLPHTTHRFVYHTYTHQSYDSYVVIGIVPHFRTLPRPSLVSSTY